MDLHPQVEQANDSAMTSSPLPREVTEPTDPERRNRQPGGRLRRVSIALLARLHRWAESGWSGPAVATWGVLQGSVFPGPLESLILPLGIADPPRVWRLAAWATVGAVIGAFAAYLIGALAFEGVGRPLLALMGVGANDVTAARAAFARSGATYVFLAALAPIVPGKVVWVLSGALGMAAPTFVVAVFAGRALRFLISAALIRGLGVRISVWIERRIGRPIDRAS